MRPIILWTADVKGWAYHTRIVTMQAALPHYDHRVWFHSNVPGSLLKDMMDLADVIVCQGVKPIARVLKAGASPEKVVVRIDSVRVDHQGQYIDVFKVARNEGDQVDARI